MKYLKNFETDPQYQQYIGGAILPNVSYVKDDNQIYYNPDPANGHPYVEIGGVKWATMNLGATSETDPGLYFQWGDTVGYTVDQVGDGEGKKYFGIKDYKYYNWQGESEASYLDASFTKYNYTDKKGTLDLEDDAAHVQWGGRWVVPDKIAHVYTLRSNTNQEYVSNYKNSGTNGWLFIDKKRLTKKHKAAELGFCQFFSVALCLYVESLAMKKLF